MNDIGSFFRTRREAGVPLVLATVISTRGSTYSKTGARLLIDADGIYRGLLSGGCLEGDLGIRARQVIETGACTIADYDFSDDDDELWGMGVGCDGSLRILLQPLTPANAYEPYASIDAVLQSDSSAVLVTIVESPRDDYKPGDSLFVCQDQLRAFGIAADELHAELKRAAAVAAKARRSGLTPMRIAGGEFLLHSSFVEPPPRLLILGAGPDVEPLMRFARELAWRCTIVDHRPAYIENPVFAGVDRYCASPESLSSTLDLKLYDRAVIMSHHLASDREYLRQLAASDMNYVGLLGPPGRRDRLLEELGEVSELLAKRLHGPAGLNIRARGPAAIALSIVAEIQQVLH